MTSAPFFSSGARGAQARHAGSDDYDIVRNRFGDFIFRNGIGSNLEAPFRIGIRFRRHCRCRRIACRLARTLRCARNESGARPCHGTARQSPFEKIPSRQLHFHSLLRIGYASLNAPRVKALLLTAKTIGRMNEKRFTQIG